MKKMKKWMACFLAASMALSAAACGKGDESKEQTVSESSGQSGETTEKTTITVTFRDDGQLEKNVLYMWLTEAYESYPKKDEVELKLAPLTVSAGDYFAKVALSLQSEDTAPDLIAEDTFQLGTDVNAGFLEPLDEYLVDYEDWNNGSYYEKLKAGCTAQDGKVYAIPYNTDVRGLWYNKEIFKKAGLPEEWQPKTWNDILDACKAIKENVPDVVPFWCNSGVATGEATSMETYQMLYNGTGEKLLDEDGKWVVKSKGILDTLGFLSDVYSNGYGPSLSKVLNGQAGVTASQEYMPQGKLGILIDGNWLPMFYNESGPVPWPEYVDTLGFAAMPTQNGDEPGTVTMSGGWGWAIPSKSDAKDATFDFIKHMMSEEVYTKALVRMNCITTRTDTAERSEYTDLPFMAEAADMLNGTNFRPLNEKYPSVSTCIQSMVESVVSGTKPEEAMAQYAVDVERIVGSENVVEK